MSVLRPAATALASFFTMGVFWGAWAALVPEIQLRTAATPPELGAALLWAGAAALPAMFVTGRLWTRFGQSLVPATLALFGLVAIGPAIAPGVPALAVGLALVGAASGALDVAMNAQVSQIEATTARRLMFLAHALFSLGVLLTSVAVGVLRTFAVEPLSILAVVAVTFLVLAAVAVFTYGRARDSKVDVPASAVAVTATNRVGREMLVLLGLLCAAAFLIEDAMVSWSALHLERTLDAEPAIGSAGPGLFAGAMFVGRAMGQAIGRRFSDRDILVGAGLIGAAGLSIVAVAPTSVIALGGLVVAGVGVSVVGPALFSRAGRLAGERGRGAAIASLTVFGYTGFIVGPPVVGLIAGATELRVSFATLAGLALATAVVSWLTVREAAPAHATADELPPVARA